MRTASTSTSAVTSVNAPPHSDPGESSVTAQSGSSSFSAVGATEIVRRALHLALAGLVELGFARVGAHERRVARQARGVAQQEDEARLHLVGRRA